MRHAPRKVRPALALLLACGACSAATHAQARAATPTQSKPAAQPGRDAQPSREPKASDAKARAARAQAEKTRRKAVAALLEVAGDAKAIENLFQRASVLSLCADALWEADERAARTIFARAWEAAAESDDAELKNEQDEGRYGDLPERFTRARDLVLAAAARRDTRMAEPWLGALADWLSSHESSARDESAPGHEASRDAGQLNEFTRDGQRLGLAYSLLDAEEYEAAARVAAPTLQSGVSGALIEFLLELRFGAREEADRLYLQLLAATRANPNADANDVLLLSSYVLAPRLLAVVGNDASLQFRAIGEPPDPETGKLTGMMVSARARTAFFDAATAILLRPLQSLSGGGAAAAYFTIGRLLFEFQHEAPQHAPALQARLAELAATLDEARRAALDSKMRTQSLSPSNPTDPLADLLDTIKRTDDPGLRDDARLQVVEKAAKKKLWERARRLTEEIEDAEKRRAARALIDMYTVASVGEAFSDDEEDGFERAAAIVRAADVSPALRAYGFAAAAEMAARRGKRARAEALLGEALSYASQAEAGTSPRDAAAMATATVAARSGSPRAWEALVAAVAALNEDEMFDGDSIWFNLEQRVKFAPGEADALNEAFGPFTIPDMFEAAARVDFGRAVAEARNLKSVPARSRALVAAALVALERKESAGGAVRPSR
ncbi:MAG TPA: hypothetical protein VFZ44_00215 [Pyrinomonadaceae bacterium]